MLEAIRLRFLAHGLHTVASHQNRNLAVRILAQGGALVSEYAPGTDIRPTLPSVTAFRRGSHGPRC